jgi:hypothetical protein
MLCVDWDGDDTMFFTEYDYDRQKFYDGVISSQNRNSLNHILSGQELVLDKLMFEAHC